MPIRITMLTTVMGPSGTLLTPVGSPYTVPDAFALEMIGGGKAVDTDSFKAPKGVYFDYYDGVSSWAERSTGSQVGAQKFITDVVGGAGAYFTWNGSRWTPVNGVLLLAQLWGSLVSPVGTISASTGAIFSLPGGNPVIPAGLLGANSSLDIVARIRRRGAAGTATIFARLGTSGTAADGQIVAQSASATNNLDIALGQSANFGASSSEFFTQNFMGSNGTSSSSALTSSSNVDTSSDMQICFGVSSANVADSFDLIGYGVRLNF